MANVRVGTGQETGRRSLWRFAPLAVVVLAIGAVFASGAHRYLTPESLVDNRDRLQAFVAEHRVQAVLAYMGLYITAATLSIPGAVFLTILGGFLFGWLVGGAAAVISASLGAVGIFLIARTSIGDALLQRAGPRIQRLAEGFRQDAFAYLLFIRIVPLVPFWITNLASAFFGVRLKTFSLATMVGLIPGTYAYAFAGSGLDSLIETQLQARNACLASGQTDCPIDLSLASLITPELIGALAAIGLLILVPVVLKRLFGDRIKWLGGGQPKRDSAAEVARTD